MLFGIPATLPAELLQVLASMGHGDELVIADANFPSASTARHTHVGHAIELIGRTSPQAANDILSLMPLDSFVEQPALAMEVPGNHEQPPAVHQEVINHLDSAPGSPWKLTPLDRFEFYDRATKAFVIVRTMERRPYGCFVFVKGVLTPDGDIMTPEFANRI